jgi:DNA-directed RNA polymerase subunit alpha
MNDPIFEINKIIEKDNLTVFEIGPLVKGFGQTLGNSLRRVLLRSLPGMAVTSVKMAGVKHQFSSLKGMKEDVVEFILNLKKIRFATVSDSDKPEKVKLSVKGPGEVKAKDLQLPATLKIANPELVLASLNKDAKLEAEMQVGRGVGYSPADEREERGIGIIPVDAIYSPIVRVNYRVEETRVGRVTDYDKLILEIVTDGTINAKKALIDTAVILTGYFHQIVSPKAVVKEEVKQESTLGPLGKLSVEEIGLPTRVANALVKAGYEIVEDLVTAKKEDLAKIRNLGEKSVKIISAALAEKGVEFPAK